MINIFRKKKEEKNGFYDTDVWKEIDKRYGIRQKLWNEIQNYGKESLGEGVVIYGEIFGKGIQKNYEYGLKSTDIKFFNVMFNGKYMPTEETKNFIENALNLKYVQVLYVGRWSKDIQDSCVLNQYIPGTKIPEEGAVIKGVSGDQSKMAKAINPDYLIYAEKKDVGDSH